MILKFDLEISAAIIFFFNYIKPYWLIEVSFKKFDQSDCDVQYHQKYIWHNSEITIHHVT